VQDARRRGDLRRFDGTSPDGRQPTLWIVTGSGAWDVAHRWSSHRLVVVLPSDADPADIDWRCLADADPVLLFRAGDVDDGRVRRAVAAAFRDGVERILDLETGERFIRETAEAAT